MEQDSIQEELDYLKSLKKEKPDLFADELGVTLASAIGDLYVGSMNQMQYQRGRRAVLSLLDMVDEVSQDPEYAPVFANAFASQLKASLSPKEK